MRLKSGWFNKDKERSLAEKADALGFNLWSIAINRARHMEGQGFKVDLPKQTLDVLDEFAIFLMQAVDRYIYGRLNEQERNEFIQVLAKKLVSLDGENRFEAMGAGDYATPFIAVMNERLGHYAAFPGGEKEGEVSYAALRYLGEKVEEIVKDLNQGWVKEQVIEIEGNGAIKSLMSILPRLMQQDEDSDKEKTQ